MQISNSINNTNFTTPSSNCRTIPNRSPIKLFSNDFSNNLKIKLGISNNSNEMHELIIDKVFTK